MFAGVHFLSNAEPKSILGCDIYIDDAPHVAKDVLESGAELILFDQPWNHQFAIESNKSFYIADDWTNMPQVLGHACRWLSIKDAQ